MAKRYSRKKTCCETLFAAFDKKLDYSAKEGAGARFTMRLKLPNHEADVVPDLDDLRSAGQT